MSRILLIEDDPHIAQLVELAMVDIGGHSITVASNGKAGIALLDKSEHDILLLDLMLPDIDGFGILEHIGNSAALAALPVVVTTARKLDGLNPLENYKNVAGIIHKPFDPMTLSFTVEEMVKESQ